MNGTGNNASPVPAAIRDVHEQSISEAPDGSSTSHRTKDFVREDSELSFHLGTSGPGLTRDRPVVPVGRLN
jgi:hypothetical protein